MDHVELFQKIEGQDLSIVISTLSNDIVLEARHIRISLEGAIMWENNIIGINWEQAKIEEIEDGFIISVDGIEYSIMFIDAA